MQLKKYFWITLGVFLILWGVAAYAIPGFLVQNLNKNEQIQQIDQEINELQDMKRGYEARALRHEDQADRLQFDDKTYLEMRRHNQLAEENRAKAAAIQREIDRLQAERDRILNIKK